MEGSNPEPIEKFIFDFNQEDEEFSKEDPIHRKYMLEYLVNKCQFDCDNTCFMSHRGQELRRKPTRLKNGCWNYIPQQCIAQNCEFRSQCMFAHMTSECLYHPMVYKTIRCGYPLRSGVCSKNGPSCPMSHSIPRSPCPYSINSQYEMHSEGTLIAQIEANRQNMENYSTYKVFDKNHFQTYERLAKPEVFDLNSFKTKKCEKKIVHNEKICLYFHPHLVDRRRKHKFAPTPCPEVFDATLNVFVIKDCPNGDACRLAHSQNEILYHPEVYRTELCSAKPCELGEFCSNLHIGVNVSFKEIENELVNIKNSHEQLVKSIEETKKQMERLKGYVCVFCKKKASSVLFCGHLSCAECELIKCCGVQKKPLKIAFKSN